jgi:hypothetical protein
MELRPLTVLAGANSSGKSSAMQPLLLLKQTLEATFDPGPLLIDGPNVRFTSADQLATRLAGQPSRDSFSFGLEVDGTTSYTATLQIVRGTGLRLVTGAVTDNGGETTLTPDLSSDEIKRRLPKELARLMETFPGGPQQADYAIARDRVFLRVGLKGSYQGVTLPWRAVDSISEHLRSIIHVPGLRGNPLRTYRTTAVGRVFPGTFEPYVASVVHDWQRTHDPRQQLLASALHELGLTWKIESRPLDDTQVELRVGRLARSARGGAFDMVSVADVGFGVSQSLPVVVALLAAQPSQLVYVEQPEIHLHPRAQVAMAKVIEGAVLRGIRVVVETHSDLLLLAFQTLIAGGSLPASMVKLHWFTRDSAGLTSVTSADPDERGSYGPWPEDFSEVDATTGGAYLNAASRHGRA